MPDFSRSVAIWTGIFTSLFIKVSALCQLVKYALICLPRKRNKVEREEMRMGIGGEGRGIHRPCGCGILNLMCVCHQIGKKSLTNVFTGFFL